MTNAINLAHQLTQARNELNNLRKTIRGLQAEHQKDVSQLKEVIARTHTPTPKSLLTHQQPASTPDTSFFHDWKPIGHIKSWFRTKNGTPRQGSVSSLTRGVLKLASHTFNNPHHALQGLQEFSHIWILFVFDKNEESGRGHRRSKVAPPRLGGQRVGVFSTRSPHRPNPLGLTLARLDKVEGDCLYLSGLDILDGTPVLDVKPYILQYDAPPVVASQFKNYQTMPVPAKSDEEDADSLYHGNCLASKKHSHEPNQKENQPLDDILRPQTHTEKIACSDNDVSFNNQKLEKLRLGKLSQTPATAQDSGRTEGEVVLSESPEHTGLSSEASEDSKRVKETHVPHHMKETAVCTEGEQESEKQDEVLMAPWIAAPPTVSLQVLFNPIAEQQVQAFSRQAEDGKYRLEYLSGGEELREAITNVLQQDPRSVYRRRKCPSLLYYFSVDTAHVTAWFEGSCAEVLRVQPLTNQSYIHQKETPSSLVPSVSPS